MRTLRTRSALVAPVVVGLVVVVLLALAQTRGSAGDEPDFYTVSTAELSIPAPGDGTGNLQANVLCNTGDIVVGGGHIIHPSSTGGIFVTKSYATDTSGAFAPAAADRWRVKVLNPADLSGKKLTVHAVCAKN